MTEVQPTTPQNDDPPPAYEQTVPNFPEVPGASSTPIPADVPRTPHVDTPRTPRLEETSKNHITDMAIGDASIMEEDNNEDRHSKQASEIARSVSLSGILKDIEIESIDRSPHSPDDFTRQEEDRQEVTVDIYTSRMSELNGEMESVHSVKLPSITPRGSKARRAVRNIAKRPFPKYSHYNYGRKYYLYNTRIRLSKVFSKQHKFVILKSEANFIRMCKIVIILGTAVMKEVLKSFTEKMYPPKDFQQFLDHFKRRLISYASTEKLISDRWKTLFPEDVAEIVSLQKLDPALVFWFLRHLCHFKKQTDFVWKWKPSPDDLSAMADVTRIRDHRNGLINAVDHALFDEEYERKIEDINAIISRVCSGRRAVELQESLKEMKTGSVKIEERDEYLYHLNKWADEIKDRNIDKITPSKQDWNTTKVCKAMSKRFLKRFRKPKVFVKTTMYQQAKDILLENGFVVLKGNTGEGKTTAALAMLASLYEEDDILVPSSAEHWKYVNKHTVGAMLIDDFLGSMHFNENDFQEWKDYLPQIHRCCSVVNEKQNTAKRCEACGEKMDRPGAKVIITIRKHVFDQQKKLLSEYKIFNEKYIVDFSSKELNFTEKRTMLSRHVVAGYKIKSEVDKSSKLHTSTLGFPQTCSLFVSKDEFMDMGSLFFENPIEIMRFQLDRLYQTDQYGYLILVIMMFQPGGVISHKKLKEFKDETFRTSFLDLALVCGVPVNKQLPRRCLVALSNLHPYTYYYDDIGYYTFSHESVMEIMMSTFVERHPQHVLETCALQFIMDYVATDIKIDESRDQIFTMRIQRHNFWLLTELFEHYITHGYVVKVAQHRAFRDSKFLNFFFDFVKKKPAKEELILRIDNTTKDEEQKEVRRVGLLYGAVDQEKPNAELAIAILKLGCHVSRLMSSDWCLSELKSSLGVAARRGNYDIYSAIVSMDIDIPDKLLVKKQYLTSLKIVTDLLKRRPWSKEQKDVALVRASRRNTKQSTDIVLHLLNNGASVSSIRAETTALCEAVKSGSLKTVSVLLNYGASIYDRDLKDQTPLHHACDWNQIEIAKLLVAKGADLNTRDAMGLSPFVVAAGWEREEFLDMFLSNNVHALTVDEQENNVVHVCAASGRTSALRKILGSLPEEMTTCLTARNKYGWTPLDFAIRCGHLGVAKLLVRTILRQDPKKNNHTKPFTHMRFNIVKKKDFDKNEKYSSRFVDLDLDGEYYQVPKCKWFVQAGSKVDYDKVTLFVARYDDRLRTRCAKT